MATAYPVYSPASAPGLAQFLDADTCKVGLLQATQMTLGSVVFAGASGLLSQDNANFFWDATNRRLGINAAAAPSATLHVVQQVITTGSPTAFKLTGGAHTTLTASVEAPDVYLNLARTVQFATGALAAQRAVKIEQPTYGFVGASTITDAATVSIMGAPVKGTNTTITNTHALRIEAGAVSTAAASYGLTVNAQTGATANYCAQFIGGNVGINTTTPDYLFHVAKSTTHSEFLIGDKIENDTADGVVRCWIGNSAATAQIKIGQTATANLVIEWGYNATPGNAIAEISTNSTGANALIIQNYATGKTGFGISPTATVHLKAGTTAASTAPLKLTSGPLMTAPEAGAIEFLTDTFYGTITTATERKAFAFAADVVPMTTLTEMQEPTGFVDRTATLSWTNTSPDRTFTITGAHDIYIKGVKYSKTTTSIQIADTNGDHFIYYNSSGVLSETTDFNVVGFFLPVVATVYWNSPTGIVGEERHGITMDGATHGYLHATVGARYNTGLALSAVTNTTFQVDAGSFYDEDILNAIGSNQTTCDVFYRDGSTTFKWHSAQTALWGNTFTTLRYNSGNSLLAVPTSNYCAYWVFASNAVSPAKAIVVVIGQRQDTSIANARANNVYDSLTFGSLPFKEMKLLYRVIYRNVGGTPTHVETADYRSISNLPSGTYVATSHSTLGDLLVDTHTQYALLAGREANQILIGGTTVTGTLTLRATSGVGEAGSSVILQVGNNGSINGLTVAFDGKVTTYAQATTTTEVLRAGRSVSTGTGLSGGGDLTSDRTLTLDQAVIPTWTGAHTFTGGVTFKNHSAFAGSGFIPETRAIQTTTVTPAVLWSKTLVDNTLYWVEVRVIGRDVAGVARAYYGRTFYVYRQSAGSATLGNVIELFSEETDAAWDLGVNVNTNDVEVKVTGKNSVTINWAGTVTMQAVSGNA